MSRKYAIYLKDNENIIDIVDSEPNQTMDAETELISNAMSSGRIFKLGADNEFVIVNPFTISAIKVTDEISGRRKRKRKIEDSPDQTTSIQTETENSIDNLLDISDDDDELLDDKEMAENLKSSDPLTSILDDELSESNSDFMNGLSDLESDIVNEVNSWHESLESGETENDDD